VKIDWKRADKGPSYLGGATFLTKGDDTYDISYPPT